MGDSDLEGKEACYVGDMELETDRSNRVKRLSSRSLSLDAQQAGAKLALDWIFSHGSPFLRREVACKT